MDTYHSAHVTEYQEWLDAKDWDDACAAMLRAEGEWEDNGCRPLTDSDYL